MTVRIPKSSANESLATPATCASSARWYSGCAPIWYGHHNAGWRMRSPGTRAGPIATWIVACGAIRALLVNGISVPSWLIEPTSSTTCGVPVLLRRSALTVSAAVARLRESCWTTCVSRSETGPSCASWGANWRPVNPSGEGGFQSTMLSVR